MSPAVLDRIVRHDGWIARPTCPADLIALDRHEIRDAQAQRGLQARPFTFAHENFTWLEEKGTPRTSRRSSNAGSARLSAMNAHGTTLTRST